MSDNQHYSAPLSGETSSFIGSQSRPCERKSGGPLSQATERLPGRSAPECRLPAATATRKPDAPAFLIIPRVYANRARQVALRDWVIMKSGHGETRTKRDGKKINKRNDNDERRSASKRNFSRAATSFYQFHVTLNSG